jgi:hypothetical protein
VEQPPTLGPSGPLAGNQAVRIPGVPPNLGTIFVTIGGYFQGTANPADARVITQTEACPYPR